MHEKRYPELDALRGIAVVLMVVYHFLFDLAYLYEWDIPVTGDAWMTAVFITATLFFLLVGICFVISWERASSTVYPEPFDGTQDRLRRGTQHDTLFLYPKYLRRGLLIFSGGMLITLITWWATPDFFVKFGALHLIGVAALLQPFFIPLKKWNALLGSIIIVLPPLLTIPTLPSLPSLLFFVGFPAPNFSSLDYFPLLPWFGVILLGMALGYALYIPPRQAALRALGTIPYHRTLLFLGRRSLWIYFAHQPVILLILSLVLGLPVQG